MIEMKVFSRLSKTEKVVGLGLLVVGGILIYEIVKPKTASAATLPSGQPMPMPGPSQAVPPGDGGFASAALAQAAQSGGSAPPIPPGVPVLPSPYQSVSSGATSYIVTTSAPASDPSSRLKVRQGPGVSYPTISWLMKGQTVSTSGSTTKNPVDGYTWTTVLDQSGQPMGWVATAYLTAGSGAYSSSNA